MTWFRVDDKFHSHVKPARAGLAAVGAWTLAGSWCGDHLTDGKIPREVAHKIAGKAIWEKLFAAGLVTLTDEGYQLHDFLDWNPSGAKVKAERARKSEAGRQGGVASGVSRSKNEAAASHVLPEAPELPSRSRPDPVPIPDPRPERDPDPERAQHPDPAKVRDPPASPLPPSGTAQILAALAAVPAVARAAQAVPGGPALALLRAAEVLAGRAEATGKLVPWVLVAIGEAAADLATEYPGGASWRDVTKRLRTYADRAKRPAAEGSGNPRDDPRSTLQRPAKEGEFVWKTGEEIDLR